MSEVRQVVVDQSKKSSLTEALVNVAVGFVVSMISNIVLLRLYGIHVSLHTQFFLTTWFTVISISRSYLLRRFFNWRGRKTIEQHSYEAV